MIPLHDFLHAVLRSIQCHRTGDLNRLKNTVVEIAFQLGQRTHHFTVADTKPDSPAGHVIGLGQCVKLDAHILGLRHLQKTRRLVTVERDIRVGQIVNHNHIVLFGKCDDFLKELEIDYRSRGIVREIDDQNTRTRQGLAIDPQQIVEEIAVLTQLNPAHFAARNNETVHVDGIGRRRRKHDITRPDRGQCQVREPFFRADRDNRLGLGIQIHIIIALVPAGNRMAQFGDAARG